MALIFLQKSSYQVLNHLSKTQMHCFWWALIHLEGLNLPCVLKSAVSLGKARSAFKAKVNLYQTWRFLELSSRTVSACMDSSAKCDSKQSQKDDLSDAERNIPIARTWILQLTKRTYWAISRLLPERSDILVLCNWLNSKCSSAC